MAAFTRLVITSRMSGGDVANKINAIAGQRTALVRLAQFIRGFAVGAYRGTLELCTSAVKATATLTLAGGDISAAETFVLCGTTFTARASGATGNEFNIAAGDLTTTAANIAAAVNASATAKVTGSVVASSSGAVVTFTAKVPGAGGNGFVLTESLSNATRVDFAGGSDGTRTSLAAGGAA